MKHSVQLTLLAGAAAMAIGVAAHNTGSPPYTGYSGADIETACEDIKIDADNGSDGTLTGICHAPVTVVGVPYDETNGKVQHISTSLELKDKIQFADGDLSKGGSGGFDTLCSDITITVTSTAVTLGANCAPDSNTTATAETLEISDNIVVHDGAGAFAWYVAPSTE